MAQDPVAVYAAVVATAVAGWDFFKWWNSERVRLTGFVAPNMVPFGSAITPNTEGKKVAILRVQNRGALPCQVHLVELKAYANMFARLRGKPSVQGWVTHPNESDYTLPHKLERGGEFASWVIQDDDFVKMSREKRLYLGVSHTMSEKPFMVRVKAIGGGDSGG